MEHWVVLLPAMHFIVCCSHQSYSNATSGSRLAAPANQVKPFQHMQMHGRSMATMQSTISVVPCAMHTLMYVLAGSRGAHHSCRLSHCVAAHQETSGLTVLPAQLPVLQRRLRRQPTNAAALKTMLPRDAAARCDLMRKVQAAMHCADITSCPKPMQPRQQHVAAGQYAVQY